MKFLSALFLSTAAFAAVPSSAELESLVGQLTNAFNQVSAAAPRDPAACWKEFGKREESFTTTCPEGLEASMGRCYQPCNAGFKGFGPFCLMQSAQGLMTQDAEALAATSYQRESVESDVNGFCPANTFKAGDVCVQSDCPRQLPFTCGVICTKDMSSCTSTVATLTVQLVQLVNQLQSGNMVAAIQIIQKIWAQVSAWPKCNELANKVAFEEILTFVKNLHV